MYVAKRAPRARACNTEAFQASGPPWSRSRVYIDTLSVLVVLTIPQPHALVDDIENGCKFYYNEEQYLEHPEELIPLPSKRSRKKKKVKTEKAPSPVGVASFGAAGLSSPPLPGARKRPRRSTTSTGAKKYLVPDSDDDLIVDECDRLVYAASCFARKRRAESELQLWIKHLAALLQAEQRKVGFPFSSAGRGLLLLTACRPQLKEQKKQIRAAAAPGTKVRVARVSLSHCACPRALAC